MSNSKTDDISFVPDWAKGIVWYQIFPERFHNGDTSNDPKLKDQKGSWPHEQEAPFQIHPWESDWYARQKYELKNGLNLSDTIQRRRYGGDLQGIIDKLDYLQDLGIEGLYLNPVFDSPSSHKYDSATWHHVDPNFGPDPEGDRKLMASETPHEPSTWKWTSADKLLLQLIQQVHKRGMYIILDGVFNHMGVNSWVYQDILKSQRDSPYKNWMKVQKWADETTDGSTKVKCWEDFSELPELKQNRNGLVEGPAKYAFDITRRWMDPDGNGDYSKGVDGWRLDVAFCIKHPFWKKWRKHVRSINPQAYLLAEIIESPEKQIPFLEGDEFDAVMNYNFAFYLAEFFIRIDEPAAPSELDRKLEHLRNVYPAQVSHVMHNLLDSHDTDRVASRIMNAGLFTTKNWSDYYHYSKAENPKYNTAKPDMLARRIQKLMAAFQLTYPGAPVIYYGDEAGMWGANDPCNRKPMLWPEIKYDAETVFPNSDSEKRNFVEFDETIYRFYRDLIKLRKDSDAIRLGSYETIIADDNRQIFGFKRYNGDEIVVVLFNTDYEEQVVELGKLHPDSILYSLDGELISDTAVELQPNSFIILSCTHGR